MQIVRLASLVILLAGISGCQRSENVTTQGYDEQCAQCKDDACRRSRHCGEQIKTQNACSDECETGCSGYPNEQDCLNQCKSHC